MFRILYCIIFHSFGVNFFKPPLIRLWYQLVITWLHLSAVSIVLAHIQFLWLHICIALKPNTIIIYYSYLCSQTWHNIYLYMAGIYALFAYSLFVAYSTRTLYHNILQKVEIVHPKNTVNTNWIRVCRQRLMATYKVHCLLSIACAGSVLLFSCSMKCI